jgi:hypothetical protein
MDRAENRIATARELGSVLVGVANEIRAALEISPALVSDCRPRALELARKTKNKRRRSRSTATRRAHAC